MAGLFSLAAQRAMEMSERKPDPVRIQAGPFNIAIPMDGGLSSLEKNISIKGQPHELSYITPGEGDILQRLGGSGRMVNGIPAYAMDAGIGWGWGDDAAGDPGWESDYAKDKSEEAKGEAKGRGLGGAALGWEWAGPDQFSVEPGFWEGILGKLGASFLNNLINSLPGGGVANIMSRIATGRTLGGHVTGGKDPSYGTLGYFAGLLGGKSQADRDHMDPDEMDIDKHDVDLPSFDKDTMSEEDFPPAEQKEEEETKYKVLITNLFDDEEDEEATEENWFQDLKPEYRRILKDMYGDEVEQTGLPDILEQAYGRRGSV